MHTFSQYNLPHKVTHQHVLCYKNGGIMKKILFLSLITASINSAELQFAVKDLALPAEFPKLTELAIKKILEQYDFESVLQFIDEKCAGDENLKLAASRYWYQLNKSNLFKLASQLYGNIEPQHILKGHTKLISSVAISGDKVVTGSRDNTAIIWDLNSGTRSHTLVGHAEPINSVAIHDGKIVTGSWDKTAIIWDLNSGAKLQILNSNTDRIRSVAIFSDAIVTGFYESGYIIIWNLNSGKQSYTLKRHTNLVTSVAISDGKVITVYRNNTAIIWDIDSGARLHTLIADTAWISSVAIFGDKVVTGSLDNSAIIWDLNQPIKKLLSNETGIITFNSLIEIDKKLQ